MVDLIHAVSQFTGPLVALNTAVLLAVGKMFWTKLDRIDDKVDKHAERITAVEVRQQLGD